MSDEPFVASVEDTEFHTIQHPFHLGTDEQLARVLVEDIFRNRCLHNQPTVTIALKREGRIVDVFDGRWMNRGFISHAEVRRAVRTRRSMAQ